MGDPLKFSGLKSPETLKQKRLNDIRSVNPFASTKRVHEIYNKKYGCSRAKYSSSNKQVVSSIKRVYRIANSSAQHQINIEKRKPGALKKLDKVMVLISESKFDEAEQILNSIAQYLEDEYLYYMCRLLVKVKACNYNALMAQEKPIHEDVLFGKAVMLADSKNKDMLLKVATECAVRYSMNIQREIEKILSDKLELEEYDKLLEKANLMIDGYEEKENVIDKIYFAKFNNIKRTYYENPTEGIVELTLEKLNTMPKEKVDVSFLAEVSNKKDLNDATRKYSEIVGNYENNISNCNGILFKINELINSIKVLESIKSYVPLANETIDIYQKELDELLILKNDKNKIFKKKLKKLFISLLIIIVVVFSIIFGVNISVTNKAEKLIDEGDLVEAVDTMNFFLVRKLQRDRLNQIMYRYVTTNLNNPNKLVKDYLYELATYEYSNSVSLYNKYFPNNLPLGYQITKSVANGSEFNRDSNDYYYSNDEPLYIHFYVDGPLQKNKLELGVEFLFENGHRYPIKINGQFKDGEESFVKIEDGIREIVGSETGKVEVLFFNINTDENIGYLNTITILNY